MPLFGFPYDGLRYSEGQNVSNFLSKGIYERAG